MYVPTMIFGHLLTSSNYDDTEKKVTGMISSKKEISILCNIHFLILPSLCVGLYCFISVDCG